MGDMKSFGRDKTLEWIEFDVDGEVFKITSVAPAMAVLNVARVNEAADLDKVQVIMTFLDKVLEPESAERFAARLSDVGNPITIDQATSIAVWAMEEVYATERPTQEASPSQNGFSAAGPSSTDTAPASASTSEPQTQRVL